MTATERGRARPDGEVRAWRAGVEYAVGDGEGEVAPAVAARWVELGIAAAVPAPRPRPAARQDETDQES